MLELLGAFIFQKSPQRLRTALPSKKMEGFL